MPEPDGLDPFRDAAAKSDLAEALGSIQAHRDADVIGHWLMAWIEKGTTPDGEPKITIHTHYADEIVGLGLAQYVVTAIGRSWEDAEEGD